MKNLIHKNVLRDLRELDENYNVLGKLNYNIVLRLTLHFFSVSYTRNEISIQNLYTNHHQLYEKFFRGLFYFPGHPSENWMIIINNLKPKYYGCRIPSKEEVKKRKFFLKMENKCYRSTNRSTNLYIVNNLIFNAHTTDY